MKQQLLKNFLVVDPSEPKDIINILKEECPVLVKRVYVGDYILGDLVIERKSHADFEASIVDGRLFRQVKDMLGLYRKAVLLVEGASQSARLNPKARAAAMARVFLLGACLICTSSKEESARLIAQIYKKLGEEEHTGLVLSKKPKSLEEQKVHVLASIPGVGEKLAKELLSKFGSVAEIANAPVKEIMKIEKIGEKKAKKIKEVLS